MDNFDSNMIKPVDRLHNIAGMSPTRRREQRNKKQNFDSDSENQEQQEKRQDEVEKTEQIDESYIVDNADESKIDFCA